MSQVMENRLNINGRWGLQYQFIIVTIRTPEITSRKKEN
jgi:hypothetical protein